VPVFVAEAVGQDERVEGIVLLRCHAVAFPRSRGDFRRDAVEGVTCGLKALDQQSLASFDGDSGQWCVAAQVPVQTLEAVSGVRIAPLVHDLAGLVHEAELLMGIAPVDTGELPDWICGVGE
jgi:hypothetical protein